MRHVTAIVLLAACAVEPPTAPASVTSPLIVSGDQQAGTPGYALVDSLIVRVVDGNGMPVAGAVVNWETEARHGTVAPTTATTNADGVAATAWRLPFSEGTHWATARVGTLPAANFSSTSSSASLSAVGGNAEALCGLVNDGTVRCWQPPAASSVPQSGTITTADRFVTLAFARGTWCAATAVGRIACFTDADLMRTGAFAPTLVTPTLLTSFGPRLVQLAAGEGVDAPVFCGLTGDGEAWCWGSNTEGQVGIGTRGAVVEVPTRVMTGEVFADIDVSNASACAVTTTGAPFCWGSNASSLIGRAATVPDALVPTAVVTPLRFIGIALNTQGTACALRSSGQVYCWGSAVRDALGRVGVAADDPEPRAVQSDNIFFSIARNGSGFGAVSIDRELVVWGPVPNNTGASGPGFAVPTRVMFDERFIGMLSGGTDGFSCMKSLFGGARCVDLYVYGPAALRDANSAARPAQFGVPVR